MTASPPTQQHSTTQMFAAGATLAVAALLLVSALLTILQGISAASDDELLVIGPDYIYKFDTMAWGWIHIVLGILMGLVALGLIARQEWARVATIVMAALSIVVMFLWLPYYPVWSAVLIALDIVVIWAVATWDTSRS